MKDIFSEIGNGIVETILFIPFAFLFLFSSIDLGLAYKDRGAILSAINSGLNEEVLYNKKYQLYSLNESAEISKNENNFQLYLKEINLLIAAKIAATRGLSSPSAIENLELSTSIVELKIDPKNGDLLNYEIHKPLQQYPEGNNSSDNLEEFIKYQLQSCTGNTICSYALPASLNLNEVNKYLPYSLLIALEVHAESYGISKEINKSLLGKIFSVDEKYLKLLRIQIN